MNGSCSIGPDSPAIAKRTMYIVGKIGENDQAAAKLIFGLGPQPADGWGDTGLNPRLQLPRESRYTAV